MKKFRAIGILSLVGWLISLNCFFEAIWKLFGLISNNPSHDDYILLLFSAVVSNPRTWKFIKNTMYN